MQAIVGDSMGVGKFNYNLNGFEIKRVCMKMVYFIV